MIDLYRTPLRGRAVRPRELVRARHLRAAHYARERRAAYGLEEALPLGWRP